MANERATPPQRDAWLLLEGWAGNTEQACLVIGETPKRYRIKAIARTKLGGRCRWIYAGETALVPKQAIRFCMVPA